MDAAAFVAAPGERSIDIDEDRPSDDFSEQDALEAFAKQLGEKTFECELIDAASNAFARRILGCSTIQQAQNEAKAWLGIAPTF